MANDCSTSDVELLVPAGLGARAMAVVINVLLIYFTCVGGMIVLDQNAGWLALRGAIWWPPLGVGLAYFGIVPALGGTIGMRSLSLYYGSVRGQRVSGLHALARVALGIVLLPLLPVNVLCISIDKRRRSLADIVCKTMVGRPLWVDTGFEVM